MKAPSVKPVRCAIYTRVSSEQGLDQEFNSLDAQYDAASAYIKSQAHAGWTLIRSRCDDGGYSGVPPTDPTCRDCWTISAPGRLTSSTLRVTRRMVPIMFSAMLVQASDRRSSFGSFNRTTVRISSFEDAGRYAGPLLDDRVVVGAGLEFLAQPDQFVAADISQHAICLRLYAP